MKKHVIAFSLFALFALFSFQAQAGQPTAPLTVSQLMADISSYEKKEISLTGTIVGACGSGCKVWVAEGNYQKGKPVVLVWAKDKAFTFKTDAAGRQVLLKGYAVGQYIDLCALEKEEKQKKEQAADQPQDKKNCKPAVASKQADRQLKAVTFFATSVDYR